MASAPADAGPPAVDAAAAPQPHELLDEGLGALPSAAPPSAAAPAELIPDDPLLVPVVPPVAVVPDAPVQEGCDGQVSLMLWVTLRTLDSSD